MLGIHDFWLFLLSGLLLNVAPGPDTANIAGRSVQIGWRGGLPPRLVPPPDVWCTSLPPPLAFRRC